MINLNQILISSLLVFLNSPALPLAQPTKQDHIASKIHGTKVDCTFCKIIKGESSAEVIYENDTVIVFNKPSNGQRPTVDCLIIPKKHIENIRFLDSKNTEDQTIPSAIFFAAQELSKSLSGNQGFVLEMHNGADAYQTVFHMHAHFQSNNRWTGNKTQFNHK